MPTAVTRRHARGRDLCRLGCRHMFGTVVPVNVAHRRTGKAVPLSPYWAVVIRVHCDEQILPQQVPWGCLPRCETRDGTTASRTRCILVVLHTWLLHSIAAGRVRGCPGRSPKNKYFLPDVPQTTRSAERQADHIVSERRVAQRRTATLRRTIHGGALRWCRNRPRLAQDATVTGPAPSPIAAENHKSGRDSRPRRTHRKPELAVPRHGCGDSCFRDDRTVPNAIQEAPMGTRQDNRTASEFGAAVLSVGGDRGDRLRLPAV